MSLSHYDYLEITAPYALEDSLQGVLWQLGYDGLVEENLGDQCRWKVFFPADTHHDHLLRCVQTCVAFHPAVLAEIRSQKMEDWSSQWKSFFKPVHVSPQLMITTEGIEQPLSPGQKEVVIVAGMAFGTGQHPTTQLIARAIARDYPERKWVSVLDVGTGTGILGLVALACGVPHVDAMDIDPDSLVCVEENAIKNKMMDRISLSLTLEEMKGPYPCLVANILLTPLLELVAELTRRLASGGDIYLSGILKDQVDALSAAYLARGLDLVGVETQDEWAMVHLRKG